MSQEKGEELRGIASPPRSEVGEMRKDDRKGGGWEIKDTKKEAGEEEQEE
jgi:hypothetical protein